MHGLAAIPTRRNVYDVFVPQPTYGFAETEYRRFGHVAEIPDLNIPLSDLRYPPLPTYEKIEFMGTGASACYLADVPDYARMLEYPFADTLMVRTFRFPQFAGRPIPPT